MTAGRKRQAEKVSELARRTRRRQLYRQQETVVASHTDLFVWRPQNVHLTLSQARPHNPCILLQCSGVEK